MESDRLDFSRQAVKQNASLRAPRLAGRKAHVAIGKADDEFVERTPLDERTPALQTDYRVL